MLYIYHSNYAWKRWPWRDAGKCLTFDFNDSRVVDLFYMDVLCVYIINMLIYGQFRMRQNVWQHLYQVAGRSCLLGVANQEVHWRCYLVQLQGNSRLCISNLALLLLFTLTRYGRKQIAYFLIYCKNFTSDLDEFVESEHRTISLLARSWCLLPKLNIFL
jgi:hypothetical protein